MKITDWIENNPWSSKVWWLIVGAVITLVCEKACNKIVPDNPVVVKEVADSIRVIHAYDLNIGNDSIVKAQLKMKLDNIALAQLYESQINEMIKQQKHDFNSIMLNSQFPNAKGCILGSGMAYFEVEISSLQNDFLDIKMTFLNTDIANDIYCLSIKIDAIENDKRLVVFDENYNVNVNRPDNHIRITNGFPKGTFRISVGFFLKRDLKSEYPRFYQISKTLRK